MILNANIKAGKNTFSKLPELLNELGYENPIILVDKNLYGNSVYVSKNIHNIVKEEMLLFYDSPFEPSYQMLDNFMIKIKKKNILKKEKLLFVALPWGKIQLKNLMQEFMNLIL